MSLAEYILKHKGDKKFIDGIVDSLDRDLLVSDASQDEILFIQIKQLQSLLSISNFFKTFYESKNQNKDIHSITTQIIETFTKNGYTPITYSFFLSLALVFFDYNDTIMEWINPFDIDLEPHKDALKFSHFGYGTNIETLSQFDIRDGVLFNANSIGKILYIPKTVHTISENALQGKNFQMVFLPKTLKNIESRAFKDCQDLTTVFTEDVIHHLNDGVFQNCSSLNFFTNIGKIKSLGKDVFSNTKFNELDETLFEEPDVFKTLLSQLRKIRVLRVNTSESLRTINKPSNIHTLILSNNIDTLDPDSFSRMIIHNLNIESSQLKVAKGAFSGSKIGKIKLEDSNYKIIDDVFVCHENSLLTVLSNNLESLSIPESIEVIETGAIDSLDSAQEIIIHSGIQSIKKHAISNCPNLKNIIFKGDTLDSFDNEFIIDSTIEFLQLEKEIVSPIKSVFPSLKRIVLGDIIKKVYLFQFSDLKELEKINLETIEYIDDFAFYNCVKLKDLSLNNVDHIGFGALSQCFSLESLSLEIPAINYDDQSPILFGAIFDVEPSPMLKEVIQMTPKGEKRYYIPKTLSKLTVKSTKIPKYYFSGLNDLSFSFKHPIKSLEEYALYNTNIKSINLENESTLGLMSLSNCRYLEVISNLDKASLIDQKVFMNCSSLKFINIQVNDYKISIEELKSLTSLEKMDIKSIKNPDWKIIDNYIYDQSKKEILFIPPKYNPKKLILKDIKQLTKDLIVHFTNLEEIELHNVEALDNELFSGFNSLKKLSIGADTKYVGKNILNETPSLEELIVPFVGSTKDHLYEGDFAFYYSEKGLNALKYLTIFSGNILKTSFNRLKSLKTLNYEGLDDSIGHNAFKNLPYLEDVYFSNGIHTIGECAFENCQNLSFDFHMNNPKVIENQAFKECKKIQTIKFNQDIEFIGTKAFLNCTNLRQIDLPYKEIIIENNAFHTQSFLDFVKLPLLNNKIENIFTKDLPIKKLKLYANFLPNDFIKDSKHVESISIDGPIEQIPEMAFSNCASLQHVEIKSQVKTIGERAFYNSKKLRSIKGLQSVSDIKSHSFQDCIELETIDLPSAEQIGDQSFKNCKSLIKVNLGKANKIGHSSFKYCSSLKKLEGIENIAEVGQSAFVNCDSLSEIFLPKLNMIRENTFKNCESLKFFEISNACKIVEKGAFKNCANLRKVSVPLSVNYIENFAFENAFSDLKITLPKKKNTKLFQKYWNYKSKEVLDNISTFKKIRLSFSDKFTTIKE